MVTIRISDLLLAGAVAAVFAMAMPESASATEYSFTGAVQNLGNLSNPGTLDFSDSGATGVNDGTHFDFIYNFTLANPAKIDASVTAAISKNCTPSSTKRIPPARTFSPTAIPASSAAALTPTLSISAASPTS
jgi:hypothetical protein